MAFQLKNLFHKKEKENPQPSTNAVTKEQVSVTSNPVVSNNVSYTTPVVQNPSMNVGNSISTPTPVVGTGFTQQSTIAPVQSAIPKPVVVPVQPSIVSPQQPSPSVTPTNPVVKNTTKNESPTKKEKKDESPEEQKEKEEKKFNELLKEIDNQNKPVVKTTPEPVNASRRVQKRSSKKTNRHRQFNEYSVLLITLGLIIIFASILFIFLPNRSTKNGALLKGGDTLVVKNSINNYTMQILEIQTRVSVESKSVTASLTTSNYFTRIKVQFYNRKHSATTVRGINEFYLIDSTKQILAPCYTANDLLNYAVASPLSSSIEAQSTMEGYLYCLSDGSTAKQLEVRAVTSIDQEASSQGQLVSTGWNIYYFDLFQ